MEVIDVRQHTADVKSVRLRFKDAGRAREFGFRVGQFGIFSAFGSGESTFNICSSSTWNDHIEFCFRKVGGSRTRCGRPARATRWAFADRMATAIRWRSGGART